MIFREPTLMIQIMYRALPFRINGTFFPLISRREFIYKIAIKIKRIAELVPIQSECSCPVFTNECNLSLTL